MMHEFWKYATDKNEASQTDLSKAFVTCLITKPHAYGLDISFLNLTLLIYQIVTKELE